MVFLLLKSFCILFLKFNILLFYKYFISLIALKTVLNVFFYFFLFKHYYFSIIFKNILFHKSNRIFLQQKKLRLD